MKGRQVTRIAMTVFLSLMLAGHAGGDEKHHKPSAAASPMADGEVRRVDRGARKLTIRHGPIPSLEMDQPMTMVFGVSDPAMLERVKAGDKIRFQAEKIGGAYTVTKIEPAP